jgi:hypothetical protein
LNALKSHYHYHISSLTQPTEREKFERFFFPDVPIWREIFSFYLFIINHHHQLLAAPVMLCIREKKRRETLKVLMKNAF